MFVMKPYLCVNGSRILVFQNSGLVSVVYLMRIGISLV